MAEDEASTYIQMTVSTGGVDTRTPHAMAPAAAAPARIEFLHLTESQIQAKSGLNTQGRMAIV